MNPKTVSSLILGTVQFGLPYGIANKTGQPDQAMVIDIVRTAWENGIREFDTAQDYGISEKMLGNAFLKLGISAEAEVISKIDPILDHCDPNVMFKALHQSLEKLCVSRLFGLMLHKEELLDQWPNGLGNILRDFVTSGKVKRLGVSIYSPERALEALDIKDIDMIQVPSNILDRRFERAGVFELAVKKKKQVYIRSVFLQGLILMEKEELLNNMYFAGPVIDKIKSLSKKLNLTRKELALGYIKAKIPGSKVIIGVDTPEQLMRNIKSWERKPEADLVSIILESFGQIDEKILNPSMWRNH